MTEIIEKIFERDINLISLADKAVIYLREEEYEKALPLAAKTADKIKELAEIILQNHEYFELVSSDSIYEMLEGIVEAKKSKDYILLADLFELQLINFACSVQQLIMKKEDFLVYNELEYVKNIALLQENLIRADQSIGLLSEEECETREHIVLEQLGQSLDPANLLEQGYCVEFTTCGLMTVGTSDLDRVKFYLHTNHLVMKEAFLLARKWYCKNAETYIVYGFGMSYHIQELLELSPDTNIEIYEGDMNILKLSCAFSRISPLLENERIRIIYDDHNFTALSRRLQCMNETDRLCIHYPSLRNMKDIGAKEMLMDYIPWARKVEEC